MQVEHENVVESTAVGDMAAPAKKGRGAPPELMIRRRPGRAELNPRVFQRRRRIIEISLAWAVPIVFILVWQYAADHEWMNTMFFPSPTRIFDSGRDLIESGELATAVWITTKRALWGLLLGIVSGVLVGLLMGMFRIIRVTFEPFLSALFTVPKLALLPLLLLIFGIGDTPLILLIAITVFFFMWIATMASFLSVEEGYREAAYSFKATQFQLFRHVLFPASLPQIFVGLRLSASISVLVVVAVEFLESGNGIGHLIWGSWELFQADKMYVGIVVVALMGLVATWTVRGLGKLAMPWAEGDAGNAIQGY
jgi:ABC-type nitrate/sulfonate/bicarbonate transport system permease component